MFVVLHTNGAPRPMKMGTIVSPWRYDAGTCSALRSSKLRCVTIAHFAFTPGFPQ